MAYLSDAEFYKYSKFINNNFGINFGEAKKEMLESKIKKLIIKNGINSYEKYFNILTESNNRALIDDFIIEITVNKTDFFRESNHFNFIKENTSLITEKNNRILRNKEIRAWSAGCSTGEEAYTLAMILQESFPFMENKILATDLDPKVLKKAVKGEYSDYIRNNIEKYYLVKYFKKTDTGLSVCNEMKSKITFRQFNLMNEFPFKKGFDIIFCRNVMIYFDAVTQQKLLNKFYNALVPGGLLFIGHSEGITGKKLNYRYIQPTVYMK